MERNMFKVTPKEIIFTICTFKLNMKLLYTIKIFEFTLTKNGHFGFICLRTEIVLVDYLSPRNALRWGYSNAAVVPSVSQSVRPSVVPFVRRPCEHDRDYTVAYFFVKLGRHVNHNKRMNPIDFGGQRSKVKVTMDLYGNKLVNTIETTPLHISLSNLADMLIIIRG